MKQNTCVIWVCVDCMLHHANGECGSCNEEGHDKEPWSQLDAGDFVTMGMFSNLHGDNCPFRTGTGEDYPDCDCETEYFSRWSCSGCGSELGGSRHAFTLWWDED